MCENYKVHYLLARFTGFRPGEVCDLIMVIIYVCITSNIQMESDNEQKATANCGLLLKQTVNKYNGEAEKKTHAHTNEI